MKRATMIPAVLVLILSAGLPALAQHGGGGGAGGRGPGGPPSTPGSDRSRDNPDDRSGRNAPNNSEQKTPGELLTQNTKLAGKLKGLLPPNTDLQAASSGFKNLGEFVAAVHVSHNLDIPFSDLKGKLTGPHAESLGKAIHELKPDADANAEVKKAKHEADDDIKES